MLKTAKADASQNGGDDNQIEGDTDMQIGEIIRKYRKEKNMTQEEMANRLGVTAPAVNKWERGD